MRRVVKAALNVIVVSLMLFWFVLSMIVCFLPHYANPSWVEPLVTLTLFSVGLPLVVRILFFPLMVAAAWAVGWLLFKWANAEDFN